MNTKTIKKYIEVVKLTMTREVHMYKQRTIENFTFCKKIKLKGTPKKKMCNNNIPM